MGDIGMGDCAKLLGWPLPLVWCQLKGGKCAVPAGAAPAGTKNGQPFWHEDDVYRWAMCTGGQ